jgi:hypothetical protein
MNLGKRLLVPAVTVSAISARYIYNKQTETSSSPQKEKAPTLGTKIATKLDAKFEGIISSFPVELLGSSIMNKAYQMSEARTTSAVKPSLMKEVVNQFKNNPLGLLSATFIEHLFHRSMKVVVSEISASEFNKDKVGHLGSVVIPAFNVFLAELVIAPLHLLMIRVQSSEAVVSDLGKKASSTVNESNIFRAAHSVLRTGGIPALWTGAGTFASKGFAFSLGQIGGWRVNETITGNSIKDMSLGQHMTAVSTGAILGTITSAPSTKLFRDASVKQIPVLTLLKNEWAANNMGRYMLTAFEPKAIAAKALTKAPAHILQYTLAYSTLKKYLDGSAPSA